MCLTTTGGRNSLQKQFNPDLLSTASPAGVTSECHSNRKKNRTHPQCSQTSFVGRFIALMCLLTGCYYHVQMQKGFFSYDCLMGLTCSRMGQSCWWSCYVRLVPCWVRTQGFECRHPAPCWSAAGFSRRAPVCTRTNERMCVKV